MGEEIPGDVRAFVHAHIPSVGHMEALVLTMEEPGVAWTVKKVAERLFVAEGKAGSFLKDLVQAGLLEVDASVEQWRFSPRNLALGDVARRSVRLYRERLLAMTGLIRAGSDPGRQLADAFRFRKE